MIIYNYTAKDESGTTRKGKIEAKTRVQAAQLLRDRKLVIISLRAGSGGNGLFGQFFNRVKGVEVVTFTRQLATMVGSGLPLSEALTILRSHSTPGFAKIIDEVLRDVQGGSSLADSMSKHDVFPLVYIALVRVGEAAGALDRIMIRLADNLERRQEFLAKTKGALIYPVLVIGGMVVVGFMMITFVIPQLSTMYDDFGAELPLPTQILLGISGFASRFWPVVLAGIAGGLFLLRRWKKTEKGSYQYDKWMLAMPVFGPLKTKMIMAEFTRTLSLLITAGITILEALSIVADAVGSAVISQEIRDSATEVERGGALAEALARRDVFPVIVPQMVSVGEETGKLDEILLKISHYFETESEQAIRNLTTAMEPLIMILLGVGVFFLIIAIILPIYNLTAQF